MSASNFDCVKFQEVHNKALFLYKGEITNTSL